MRKKVRELLFGLIARYSPILAAVPMDELLAYAKAVSIFSAAPPGMSEPFDQRYAQMTGVPLIFPPFPTDEKMALGHLGSQARLGRIGEAKPVGQREYISFCCCELVLSAYEI
jgi:hypothetical protein